MSWSYICIVILVIVKGGWCKVYTDKYGNLVKLKADYQACGTLQPEPIAVDKHCCSGNGEYKFYYSSNSFCCSGTVYDKYDRHNNRKRSCCNNHLIFDDVKICCENTEHDIPSGFSRNNVSCCGDKTLTSNEICCHNNGETKQNFSKNIGCCAGFPFDKSYRWCQGKEIMSKGNMRCGQNIINLSKQSCCDGVVNNWSYLKRNKITEVDETRDCCGHVPYNKYTKRCCYDRKTLIDNHKDLQCCATESYNKTSELCCNGIVKDKLYGERSLCCGSEVINAINHTCCVNQIINSNTTQCCSFKTPIPLNSICCAGEELKNDYICCKNYKTVKKERPTHDSCCLNYSSKEARSFDSHQQVCHRGHLNTIRRQGDALCGPNLWFNPEESVCCNNKLVYFNNGTKFKCCGLSPYDEKKQMCCHGRVIQFPQKEGLCCQRHGCHFQDESCRCSTKCNGVLYNKNYDMCCGRNIYPKSTVGLLGCCGNMPYYVNQTCCNGRRHDGLHSCCGQKILNGYYKTCCGDFAIQKATKPHLRCCGTRAPYDSRYYICNVDSGYVTDKYRIHQSKSCKLSKINRKVDYYGWIVSACNSKYGFRGTVTSIKRHRNTMHWVQTITLKNVRILNEDKYHNISSKRVELVTSIPIQEKKTCFSRKHRLKNVNVIVFTSVQPTIKTDKHKSTRFNFIDTELVSNNIDDIEKKFYVVKSTRRFRSTFKSLMVSSFCRQRFQYFYKSNF